MSQIITFEIYRTEVLTISGEQFTVSFAKRKEEDEYALFAVNGNRTKSWRAFYSAEAAANFAVCTGQSLEDEVYKVLKGDVVRGHVEDHSRL
jgi:hypothetical protein